MPTKKENIPIFPIAEWKIKAIAQHGIVVFRPDFLTHPMQSLDEVQTGRFYGLTPAQCRALINDISKALDELETSSFEVPKHQQH